MIRKLKQKFVSSKDFTKGIIFSLNHDATVTIKVCGEPLLTAKSLVTISIQDIGKEVALGSLDGLPLIMGIVQDQHPDQQAIDTLRLKAQQKVEITCGQSTFSMSEDGKIAINGKFLDLTTDQNIKLKSSHISLN